MDTAALIDSHGDFGRKWYDIRDMNFDGNGNRRRRLGMEGVRVPGQRGSQRIAMYS